MFRRHIIRETQRFLKGKNLSIQWLLFESNGEIHNLEGKELEVYMVSGGHRFPVKVYTVTENAIAWTFLAGMQTKPGYYKLVLYERDPLNGLYSYDVHEAFMLVTEEEAEHFDNVISEDAVLKVTSVLTYAHISNLASVDTVEADGGKVAVVHLTNGKTFNIPVGGGGGGSSFTLLPATATKLGGIKVGFTQNGNKYPVMLDGQNKAYVEVPDIGGVAPLDTLYSNSKDYPLSANMGRVLREMIENLPSGDGEESGTVTAIGHVYYLTSEEPYITHGPNYGPNRPRPTFYHFEINSEYWSQKPKNGSMVVHLPGDGTMSVYGNAFYDEDNDEYICDERYAYRYPIVDSEHGGTPGDPGEPGRSITSVQHWFKLCADESVQATPMNVADPSSSAGGSWSLTAGSPTVQYPYLRCFMQVNYDQPLANGYTYTRSSAFTARYFNSDSSADYQELVDALSSLRQELLADLAGYDTTIAALNEALEGLRSTLSGSIANQLNELRNRLNQINGTDVELIMNDGLWAVLTSWQSETGDKKAFADIIANAQQAKITLQTGSTFFGNTQVGGNITLDGILGLISAKVTRQDVNAMIASAQFSVDPSSLNSVISKSQACWRKNGILYPYDLYLTDYMTDNPSGTLADYETYMTAQSGGPSGDSTRPAGPFELVVVVEQFSAIKQTVDEISASVDTTKYMWKKGNQYASYNAFETDYENRSSTYAAYTYEQYVTNVLGYTKIEVGSALSNITQSSDEIRAIIGDMGYFWRRPLTGGGYEYARYAVPSNMTRDEYVSGMESDGWERVAFATRMSVIDQFPDSITALVKNSTLCWIDSSATGAAYCRDYDYWQTAYENSGSQLTYEEYVALNNSSYVLTVVTDAFSRIKQTADSITSAVSRIDGHDTRLSNIEQNAEEISLAVSKTHSVWKDNVDGRLYEYNEFADAYETYKASATNPLDYEDWVENTQNCTLSDSFEEVSGIKLQGDKIWAGVGDGDDLKASISILADATVDDTKVSGESGSVIVLDADNVKINGGLQAGVVDAGAIAAGAITTEKLDAGAVNANKIDAGAVIAEKIAAGAITTEKLAALAITAAKIAAGAITAEKIAAGTITADKIATGVLEAAFANILQQLTVGENGNIVLENGLIKFYDTNEFLRMQLGQGEDDDAPVLKFYDANGVELYDLGPNGMVNMNGPMTPPNWTAVKFYYKSTPWANGNSLNVNEIGENTTPALVFLFRYNDGFQIINAANGTLGAIQYLNPFTGLYQGSHSSLEGVYLKNFMSAMTEETVPKPDDGYYIIDFLQWTQHGSDMSGTIRDAFAFSYVNGNYKEAARCVITASNDAGTVNTITNVDWDR